MYYLFILIRIQTRLMLKYEVYTQDAFKNP